MYSFISNVCRHTHEHIYKPALLLTYVLSEMYTYEYSDFLYCIVLSSKKSATEKEKRKSWDKAGEKN